MQQWVPEDFLKSLTESRERFWEQYRASMPTETGPAVEALRALRAQHLALWEKLVHETLAGQSAWVDRVFAQLANAPAPERVAEFRGQFEQGLKQWLETQDRLWSDLFTLMRGETPQAPDVPVAPEAPVAEAPVAETPAAVEPAPYVEPTQFVDQNQQPQYVDQNTYVQPQPYVDQNQQNQYVDQNQQNQFVDQNTYVQPQQYVDQNQQNQYVDQNQQNQFVDQNQQPQYVDQNTYVQSEPYVDQNQQNQFVDQNQYVEPTQNTGGETTGDSNGDAPKPRSRRRSTSK